LVCVPLLLEHHDLIETESDEEVETEEEEDALSVKPPDFTTPVTLLPHIGTNVSS